MVFLLGIGFSDFQIVPNTQHYIFVFVKFEQQKYINYFKHHYGMRTLCKTSNSLYTVFSLNEGFAIYSLRLTSELKGKIFIETNNG